jgi:hypothetical protein
VGTGLKPRSELKSRVSALPVEDFIFKVGESVVRYGSVTVIRNIPFPEGTRFSLGKTKTIPSRHFVRR